MNPLAAVFFVGACAASVVDWGAVLRRQKSLEYVFKPLAAALFLISVLTFDSVDEGARTWLAIALVWCLAGDVFLMLPQDRFVPGLASFAVGQVCLTLSFVIDGTTAMRWILAVAVVVPVCAVLTRRFIGALHRGGHRSLIPPVAVYVSVISAMAMGAIAGGSAIGIAGAALFLVSDSMIAEERFVRERRWQPVTIIITYHLALAGLVLGLL